MSSIPCLAYQKRKEAVEKQIKEHKEAKLSNKCPFSTGQSNAQTEEQTNSNENNADTTLKDLKLTNKKITVSITSNEEKLKENNLSKRE